MANILHHQNCNCGKCSDQRRTAAIKVATEELMPADLRRLVRQFGAVWVASQDGMAAIGATRKDALAGLADCLKCKTSLQIIHTWATFQGGRELVPEHVANLTTKTLAPFRLPNDLADLPATVDSASRKDVIAG